MSAQTEITRIATAKSNIKNTVNSTFANTIANEKIDAYPPLINNSIAAYKSMVPWKKGSGTNFIIEDVHAGYLEDFKMYGNIEQITYTGKNLFDNSSSGAAGQYLKSDGTIASGSDNLRYTDYIEIDVNQEYLTMSGITETLTIPAICFYDNNKNFISGIDIGGNRENTFSIPTNTKYIRTSYRTTNPKTMIEYGSTSTDYEPYVGGTPSPNPDYPQDVKVVTGTQTIKVNGKNLFNKNAVTNGKYLETDGSVADSTNYCVTEFIKIEPDTNYYLPSPDSRRFKYYNSNKQALTNDWDISNGSISQTITTPSNAYYVRFSIHHTVIDLNTYQFEKGNLATDWEAYKEQNFTINLGLMELCKIGDYQDYIYKENGKWYLHKEINKYVITGEESWIKSADHFFKANSLFANSKFVAGYGLCNQYVYNSTQSNLYASSSNNQFFLQYDRGYCNLFIRNDNYNDVNNWVSYLQSISNNILIYYPLETPIEEEITDTTLISQLNAIQTITGINHFSVSNSNDIFPTIEVITEGKDSYNNWKNSSLY